MNENDEIVIHIQKDCRIYVETQEHGIKSAKYTNADEVLKSLKSSIKFKGRISSGILPQNCIAYSEDMKKCRFVAISFEDRTADIVFEKTEYKDFPLPRLVFGFSISADNRITHVRLGVTEQGRLTPKSKMFIYPFSNVSGFSLCTGSNTFPQIKSLHQLNGIPYFILQMPNNYDRYDEDNTKLSLDYRGLLEHLKDKDSQYYYDNVLIDMGKTLSDFIQQ